jgi:hypothetical protein
MLEVGYVKAEVKLLDEAAQQPTIVLQSTVVFTYR